MATIYGPGGSLTAEGRDTVETRDAVGLNRGIQKETESGVGLIIKTMSYSQVLVDDKSDLIRDIWDSNIRL